MMSFVNCLTLHAPLSLQHPLGICCRASAGCKSLIPGILCSGLTFLQTLAECGDGVCETGTECATGGASNYLNLLSTLNALQICMPSEVAGGDNDTALAYTEVIGYGRPVVPFGYVPSGTQVNVWEGCTDSNFAGTCLIVDVGCNGCFHLEGVFVDSLSSIKILVPNMRPFNSKRRITIRKVRTIQG